MSRVSASSCPAYPYKSTACNPWLNAPCPLPIACHIYSSQRYDRRKTPFAASLGF
uniref:Uncharacterized protein n=1 Tax=Parascaris univalens TaxID=6257 RepID=A0A915B8E9_PARUN